MMEITTCIDWLSFTSRINGRAAVDLIPDFDAKDGVRPSKGMYGYRRAVTTSCGILIMFDGATETMGSHYQYSGQCLATLYEPETGYQKILDWHNNRLHKCTRLDLAIDVKGDARFMPHCHSELEEARYTGNARKITIVKSATGPGETIYCGSRQSELFVRIYDKAAETGTDAPWARIEVECKGDRARGVMAALIGGIVPSLGQLAQSVIQHVVKLDTDDWRAVFTGDAIPLAPPQIKDHDTETWALTQVASALARFESRYPERHLLERLFTKIEALMGEPTDRQGA